jgi:uncharacterized protein YcgI (DUF1989 family)
VASGTTIVELTDAQMELVNRLVSEGLGPTPSEVLRRTLLEHGKHLLAGGSPYSTAGRTVLNVDRPTYGPVRFDHRLEPVTGRAIPVLRGEVLSMSLVDGGQCVDFNAYGLHDYKEFLDCGFNRQRGVDTGPGTIVWSGSPRARPMYAILEMPDTCDQYYGGHRCTGMMYELEYDMPNHPNCQDTFSEAIREYGLTPDDVHDSYNFWMTTTLAPDGGRIYPDNRGQKGDTVRLLAFFDTLAVPVICAGDLSGVNSFYPSPVDVAVYEATRETIALADRVNDALGSFVNQQSPKDFVISEVRAQRVLEQDASYTPNFKSLGGHTTLEVDLTDEEHAICEGMAKRGIYGKSFGYCLVASLCRWYEMNRVSMRHISLNIRS